MTTIAIAGATGVVGTRALAHFLEDSRVSRVVAVGRRPLQQQHSKLTSRVSDLSDPAAVADALGEPVNVAICCLGTTIKKAGSKEAFAAVDHDAVVAFAQAALRRGAVRFVLVSSVGADAASSSFYLKTKGQTEAGVERLGYQQVTCLHPSFIDDEGARTELRPFERISLPIMKTAFSVFGKKSRLAPITADAVGRAIVRLAFDETAERCRIVDGQKLHEAGE